MNNKITLLILSTSKRPIRLIVSKISIFFISLITLIFFTFLGFGVSDYYNLKIKILEAKKLQTEIDNQKNLVKAHRRQIQSFSNEIDLLKSQLLVLNDFKKQIRVIANLNHPEARNGLFGIGGSIPDDIDTKLDLEEKHTSLIREMHSQVDQLKSASFVQEKKFEALLQELNEQKNLLASTPAICPAKGIFTSNFGSRTSPFTGSKEFHKGVDIAGPIGTPILAPADGRITFAARKGALGKLLIINHGHGLITRYAHLSQFLKKAGEKVKRGDKIALMGNTGRSTGPHLHYEVRVNNVPVNPKKYMFNELRASF